MNVEIEKTEKKLIGEIFASDEAYKNLSALCEFGSRFAGTESEIKAVRYILETFERYGLENVHAEEFEYNGWIRGESSLEILEPVKKDIETIALPYCPTTSPGGIEGEVLFVGDGLPEDFERLEKEISGKIVVVSTRSPPWYPRAVHRNEKFGRAVENGARAFIFMNHNPGYLITTGDSRSNMEAEIPAIAISFENGQFIKRLQEKGNVKVRITTRHVNKKLKSLIPMGDILGSRKPDEKIVVGAHFDGHDISQGAMDDAAGACVVMEAARVMAMQKGKFNRTIRFICFPGEELCLLGSYAYVEMNKTDSKNVKFMLNLDGAGRAVRPGIMLQGFPELIPFFQKLSKDMKWHMPVADRLSLYSDHFPFVLKGIPAGTMTSGRAFTEGRAISGRGFSHTKADTIDKVDVRDIQEASMVVVRAISRLACLEEVPFKHKAEEDVWKVIKGHGYEDVLRYELRPDGYWWKMK